jgi:hypothetical protein
MSWKCEGKRLNRDNEGQSQNRLFLGLGGCVFGMERHEELMRADRWEGLHGFRRNLHVEMCQKDFKYRARPFLAADRYEVFAFQTAAALGNVNAL